MAFSLDFSLLPSLDRAPMFMALDSRLEAELQRFPETFDRAWGALHFAWGIGASDEAVRATEEHKVRARQASLRASLAEFVGMEEALQRDIRGAGQRPPSRITDSENPLPHLIRELRNLELHLNSSTVDSEARHVFADNPQDPETPFEADIDIWYIDNLDPANFQNLQNARRYASADITKLVNWADTAQRAWGISELVRLAVDDYARRIAANH